MALTQKSSPTQAPLEASTPQRTPRIWHTPTSRANWLFLALSLLLYAGIYAWYLHALKEQAYPGPARDPLRLFGIVAFVLVVITAAYSLRRRFVRRLPGRVQDWLWLHTWFGILSILIAFLHENYANILHDYYFHLSTFIEGAGGTSALFALLFLVLSGIVGRLLDAWQARAIAAEASHNGAGIERAVEEHLHTLELTAERLSAGKSPAFKEISAHALRAGTLSLDQPPQLLRHEWSDLQRLAQVLPTYAALRRSLTRLKRARLIIRAWRYLHIPLACASLAIIGLHSSVELAKMLLQFLHR